MRQLEPAALTAIASLVMSEEEIRRRIQADNFSLSTSVERAKAKTGDDQVCHLLAIGRCLHALSRSVEQLRTTFHERPVWKLLLEVCRLPNPSQGALPMCSFRWRSRATTSWWRYLRRRCAICVSISLRASGK